MKQIRVNTFVILELCLEQCSWCVYCCKTSITLNSHIFFKFIFYLSDNLEFCTQVWRSHNQAWETIPCKWGQGWLQYPWEPNGFNYKVFKKPLRNFFYIVKFDVFYVWFPFHRIAKTISYCVLKELSLRKRRIIYRWSVKLAMGLSVLPSIYFWT